MKKNYFKMSIVFVIIAAVYLTLQLTVFGNSDKAVKHSNKRTVAVESVTDSTYTDPEHPSTANPGDKPKTNKPAVETDKKKESKAAKGTKSLAKKTAYLTFDDGPGPYTNQILDILDKNDVKATFFMLEPNMRKYPKAVKRLVEEGHIPAMHGVTHQVKKFYKSKESVLNEMNAGKNYIKKLTGYDADLIRTPYGSAPYMKKEYMTAVKNAGFMLWDWNVDSLDWKYKDARFVQTVKKQVLSLEKKGESPVILMHDRKETMKHLPEVLKFLKERGYKFQVLDDSLQPIQFKK